MTIPRKVSKSESLEKQICYNCYCSIEYSSSQLKINNANYCFNCIEKTKAIFDLLKKNGYWQKIIRFYTLGKKQDKDKRKNKNERYKRTKN